VLPKTSASPPLRTPTHWSDDELASPPILKPEFDETEPT